MSRSLHIIVAVTVMLSLLSNASAGRGDSRRDRDPSKVPGSKVRQLMLKQTLDKHLDGTLLAELNQNKKVWHSMKPEELRSLRERYYAFLKQDGKKQLELMKAAEKFHRLTTGQRQAYLKRSEWLKQVVSRLTPAERRALQKLTPAERAKRLLELKAKLADSQPAATSSASPPAATQPADKSGE